MSGYFEWTEQFSVGVSEMDEQHKTLISLTNKMIVAVEEGRSQDLICEVVSSVMAYAVEHFAREEELMEMAGYPGLEEHQEKHRELEMEVLGFYKKFRQGVINGTSFSMFLMGWIMFHISGEDKQYTAHLNAHGIR